VPPRLPLSEQAKKPLGAQLLLALLAFFCFAGAKVLALLLSLYAKLLGPLSEQATTNPLGGPLSFAGFTAFFTGTKVPILTQEAP
jgi:hypothetical protein